MNRLFAAPIAMLATLTLVVVLLWVVQKSIEFYQNVKAVGNHPGNRTILWHNHLLAHFLPPIRGLTSGTNYVFNKKYAVYEQTGWDIVTCISSFPAPRVEFLIADAAIIKDVTVAHVSFPKPVFLYRALSIFGSNIVASEGHTWKKYRKISAPAFSDRNHRLVWEESLNTTRDLINTIWKGKDVVEIDRVDDITLQIALNVIGVAGFGRKMPWQADTVVPPGHTMAFHDAMRLVSTGIILRITVTRWIMGLIPKWVKVRAAFDELELYMLEMIRNRRTTAKKEERYDLFSNLLDANDDELLVEGEAKLTDQELLGNIFVFLLAGHETTAHTLAFTFALLGLYPDQQEILYRHIKSIIPNGRNPTFEEMPLFTHSIAVLYEALRLFPSVPPIPKISAEDTVFVSTNKAGERKTIPVPQGAMITIDVAGLHYNPRYWKDPEVFNPSRFLGDWPREAFVPFSQGARACIGRKFSETESVAVLTMLISKYKITVKEKPGETFKERKERVLKTRASLTLMPVHMPLVFSRRE
ncbi:cytochrome P450 [Guyanagaster necrorhizus]|uniref:Cytochrome P450 n=1 Tax=Guyanagaster necrorhizus TaxID=856835 RepID=A0A9P7VPN1_9AGAR|nr:cytochrome P450 [Guyanagaster necrorhizus MCA 3950]KAG7445093.1 cytochrome P450 [Guyanagaster necrorhizus MCA 3950]